jgi:hypothetical protein
VPPKEEDDAEASWPPSRYPKLVVYVLDPPASLRADRDPLPSYV